MPRRKGRSWSLKLGKYKVKLGYSKRRKPSKKARKKRRKRKR